MKIGLALPQRGSTISPDIIKLFAREAEAHGFDETATRWLILLLQSDPTLPAPTAGAMVARVRQLPIGADLAAACSSDRT